MDSQTNENSFGTGYGRSLGDRPTTEELEQIEQAAMLDDDLEDVPTGPSMKHPSPDNDPYGWIRAVEEGRPTTQNSLGEQIDVHPNHVVVYHHGTPNPDIIDSGVARVLPNGTLLVTTAGDQIPARGYAPGFWTSFEHVGDFYRSPNPPQPSVSTTPPRQATNYSVQAQNNSASEAALRVMTDPIRRTPPTHESDADDTQNIPKVQSDESDHGVEGGGGVERPKAGGVRPDAEFGEHPDRRPTDAPDDGRPGFFRSLRQVLFTNPSEDD